LAFATKWRRLKGRFAEISRNGLPNCVLLRNRLAHRNRLEAKRDERALTSLAAKSFKPAKNYFLNLARNWPRRLP
jgi:hypothetical protein